MYFCCYVDVNYISAALTSCLYAEGGAWGVGLTVCYITSYGVGVVKNGNFALYNICTTPYSSCWLSGYVEYSTRPPRAEAFSRSNAQKVTAVWSDQTPSETQTDKRTETRPFIFLVSLFVCLLVCLSVVSVRDVNPVGGRSTMCWCFIEI